MTAEDVAPVFNRLEIGHPRFQDEVEEGWSPQYVRDGVPHPDTLRIFFVQFLNAPLDHAAHSLRSSLPVYRLVVRVMTAGVITRPPGDLDICLSMLGEAPLFEGRGADPQ